MRILARLMLKHLPAEIGVEPVEDGVGVLDHGLVVRQSELHAPYYDIETLGLGPPVLLVHEVRVVDELGDLRQHGISQLVLL